MSALLHEVRYAMIEYILAGSLAGILAGVLGVGGGIIVVPMLSALFSSLFPANLVMHEAIGSSLAVMIFTSISSASSYYRRDLIDWPLFCRFAPGLMLGILLGSIIAMYLSSSSLRLAFAVLMLIMAIYTFFAKEVKAHHPLPSFMILSLFSCIIGLFSGFFGIGGGTLMVPFFMYCSIKMHRATGTSSVCGLPIALIGTICLIFTGWKAASGALIPPGTTGYIYWPAVIPVAIMSVLFAPIGTRLAVWLPAEHLKKLFSIVLVIVAVDLMLG